MSQSGSQTNFLQKYSPLFLGAILILAYFSEVLLSDRSLIPSRFPDAWVFTWALDRFTRLGSLGEGVYLTRLIFHPWGTSLALQTQAEGLLFPFSYFVSSIGLARTYSFAVASCFLLNFVSVFAVFRELSVKRWLAAALAIVFSFHPFFIGHLDAGHLNFLAFFPIPLVFLCLLKSDKTPYFFTSLIAGLVTGMTAYLNLYYLYFLAMILVSVFVFQLIARRQTFSRIFLSNGFIALLATLLSLPKIAVVLQAYLSEGFKSDHQPQLHSADLAYFLFPSVNQFIGEISFLALDAINPLLSRAEIGVSFGLVILVCVALFFLKLIYFRQKLSVQQGSWLISGAFFLSLSLGPKVRWFGVILFPNPIYDLFESLPFFPSVPVRFAILALFFIFLLLAKFLNDLPKSICVVLLLLLVGELAPVVPFSSTLPTSESLSVLAQDPDVLAIHDFGAGRQHKLARQLQHRKKITFAFVARAPLEPTRMYQENIFLRYVRRGYPASSKELQSAIEQLDIQAVICERAKESCAKRVLETELFQPLSEDKQFAVFTLRGLTDRPKGSEQPGDSATQ